MYQIFADQLCIYDDTKLDSDDSLVVLNPTLSLADNAAGSLNITLPPTNVGYNSVFRLVTTLTIRKDGVVTWQGRVLEETTDFWGNRVLMCEGALAYLNDIIVPVEQLLSYSQLSLIDYVLTVYNQRVSADRQIAKGVAYVPEKLFDYTISYSNCYSVLFEQMLKNCGGHLVIRYVEQKSRIIRYLDYIEDYNKNDQTVEFGENLLDFTRKWNMSDFCTSVIPLGKSDSETGEKLTVASVNNNSIRLISNAATKYGHIERTIEFSDIEDPNNLKELGLLYLSGMQFDNAIIELSAVDLHYLNRDIQELKILDNVHFVSPPHGMDRYFPVTQIDIPLDNPAASRYVFGTDKEVSLSGSNNKLNSELMGTINKLPKENHILELARQNADSLIKNSTTGYVTLIPNSGSGNSLYITETPVSSRSDIDKLGHYWVWNHEGLAYYPSGSRGTPRIAITQDGTIAGEMLAVDSVSTDKLKAFSVSADEIVSGILRSKEGGSYFDLDTGHIKAYDIELSGVEYAPGYDPTEQGHYSDGAGSFTDINSTDFTISVKHNKSWQFTSRGLVWHDDDGDYYLDRTIMNGPVAP